MDTQLSRITIDPAVCHGKPCVRGLRYPVDKLLELLSAGMTFEEILADYEDLQREDLLAVLAFAARLSKQPDAQFRELAARVAQDDASPNDVIPWEEVKAQALAKLRQS